MFKDKFGKTRQKLNLHMHTTYTDGKNTVTVTGVYADNITLKFGDDGSVRYDELAESGCFEDSTSEKIFEDKNKGYLA